jgi:transposase InsO family protein
MPFKAERRHQIWSVDIRSLDMHSLQGIEMVYCISILENFSRSILASAISVRQDTEAFFAVFYAAVRRYGVPEMLVSDNGSIFLSHDTRRVCAQLGIEKQDFLTLEYEQEKLSRYSVEWQLDERHLARVGNPRFYRHPYQSPQQELWQAGSVEWFVIIRNAPPVRRRIRKSRLVVMQLSLLLDGTEG